jgi:hypothetical protein
MFEEIDNKLNIKLLGVEKYDQYEKKHLGRVGSQKTKLFYRRSKNIKL